MTPSSSGLLVVYCLRIAVVTYSKHTQTKDKPSTDSIEFYKNRCHELEVENARLKTVSQCLKDVLHKNKAIVPSVSSTASTLDFVSTASISNTTPTKSTPVLHDWQKANKLSSLISSYDRVPKHDEEPNYAYAHKPVRGLKRKGLPGHSCSKCDKYYKAANIDKGAIDKCSRHRSKYPRVPSPKGYWDLELPPSKWITALGSKPSPQKD